MREECMSYEPLRSRGQSAKSAGFDNVVHKASQQPKCCEKPTNSSTMPSPSSWEALQEYSFQRWCSLLCSDVLGSRTSFGSFLRSSMRVLPSSSTSMASSLFPLPIPKYGIFDGKKVGSRERRRKCFDRAFHCMVMALNFWHADFSFVPVDALNRRPNVAQKSALLRLRGLFKTFGSSGDCFKVPLSGRRSTTLIALLSDLSDFVSWEGLAGDVYSGFQGAPGGFEEHVVVPFDLTRAEELRPYRSLDPDRLKLSGRAQWDPSPHLPPDLWMAFNEPDSLLWTNEFDTSQLPCLDREDPEKVLKLALLWDINGLLHLRDRPLREAMIPSCIKVFNNYKDQLIDRQITDRRGRNYIEGRLLGVSRGLPTGASLAQLEVDPKVEKVSIFVSDRRDFYHQMKVPENKADQNMLYPPFPLKCFVGTKAHEAFIGRRYVRKKATREEAGDGFGDGERRSVLPENHVFACFASVGQGDHLGVEHATAAHRGLLKDAGLLGGTEIRGDAVFRGSKCADGLVIDDYYVIGISPCEPQATPNLNTQAAQAMAVAQSVYEKEGIEGSPHKDVHNADRAKITGAELDGSDLARKLGVVSLGAPAKKRLALAFVSLQQAKLGFTTDALMACLVGGWTSTLMFRRPFMSILDRLHRDFDFSQVEQEAPKLCSLSRRSAQELVLLAALCPLIMTNLAAPISDDFFATDASEFGGAIVETKVDSSLARALWRTGRRKGGKTRLKTREEILLRRIDPMFEEGPDAAPEFPEIEKPLAFRYHFIEICGGVGKITKYLGEKGWVCGPVIDLSFSAVYDLMKLEVILWLLHMVEKGYLDSFIVEPPCTTFSSAAYPPVRSYQLPRGFVRDDPKTLKGTTLALRALTLMYVAAVSDVLGMMETPRKSKMAWLLEWKRLLSTGLCHEEFLDSCMYGSPHKKPFRFLAANLETSRMHRKCSRDHQHIKIEGKYTKGSAVYTDLLAFEIAEVFDTGLVKKLRTQKAQNYSVAGLENALVNDLLVSKPWKTTAAWRWKGSSHINLLEAATLGRLMKLEAVNDPNKRFSVAVDSNVSISAICKGRSSAFSLRPILRRIGALQIAGCLYPALHFAPTRLNPADPPSRGRPLDRAWGSFCEGIGGEALYDLLELPSMRRFAANWVRLFFGVVGCPPWLGTEESWRFKHWSEKHYPVRYSIKGAASAEGTLAAVRESIPTRFALPHVGFDPEVLVDFDSTLGYPGEGPACGFRLFWISLLCHSPVADFGLTSCFGFQANVSSSKPLFSVPHWLIRVPPVGFWDEKFCFGGGLGVAEAMESVRFLAPRDKNEARRAASRGYLELQEGRPVMSRTKVHRDKLLVFFREWLSFKSIELEEIVNPGGLGAEEVNRILEQYGRDLYMSGRPYGHYSETINAITAMRPFLKRSVQQAWNVAYTWLRQEPPVHHLAMPWQLLVAMLSTAMAWGWISEAGVIALGFGALARIGEVFAARRSDLLLPRDFGFTLDYALLKIDEPKTRFRGARHQSARIDHPQLLKIIELAFYDLRKVDRLWKHSPQTMRLRFQKLLKALRMEAPPEGASKSIDLGSLRAGGASWLMMSLEDSELVRRRGRWLTTKVMEIYVQEVSAIQFLQVIPDATRKLILQGVAVFPVMLDSIHSMWMHGVPQKAWRFLVGSPEMSMDQLGVGWEDVERLEKSHVHSTCPAGEKEWAQLELLIDNSD